MSDLDPTYELELVVRDSDHGRMEMRTMVVGRKPLVIIEPTYDENTQTVTISVDSTDTDVEDLVDLFELLVENLKGRDNLLDNDGSDDD